MSLNLERMTTESRNPKTYHLDTMSAYEICKVMNQEDAIVPLAIAPHLEKIAQCATWASETIVNGGRIFYMGAGTSGRLGVLDAVECPPTFGVPHTMVVGLIAGGENAFVKAKEGAEDSKEFGKQDLIDHKLCEKDLVIGLAASGRTPYVIGGLDYARSLGCRTAAISCNENSEIGKASDLAIDVVVGPEVLTGSTRLKAGTAEKMILNMISTTAMIMAGKAYQNLMVDVMQTNEKLHVRAERIVMEATGVDRAVAKEMIASANGSCKKAIVMILADCDATEAEKRLEASAGHVKDAIQK